MDFYRDNRFNTILNSIIFIVLILIILLGYDIYNEYITYQNTYKNSVNGNNNQNNIGDKDQSKILMTQNTKEHMKPEFNITNRIPYEDPVKKYDLRKIYDPLEHPARRIPRHEMHPSHLKYLIDIPTRGYTDNYTQIGILIRTDDRHDNNDKSAPEEEEKKWQHKDAENRVIRLFGRQEYPGSDRYEYYYLFNNGLDQIKIPLKVRRRELYDDDRVYVPELESHYRVNIFEYDQPKYYPYIY